MRCFCGDGCFPKLYLPYMQWRACSSSVRSLEARAFQEAETTDHVVDVGGEFSSAEIAHMLEPANSLALTLCGICDRQFTCAERLATGCTDHIFCAICIGRHINAKVEDGVLPHCPSCSYMFDLTDVRLASRTLSTGEGVDSFDVVVAWELLASIPLIEGSRLRRCPGAECSFAVHVDAADMRRGIWCTECAAHFCSHCGECNHRRGVACEVMPLKLDFWRKWRNSACLEYHCADRLRKQFDDIFPSFTLHHDEAWKEQHCRKCPTCDRLVERTSGCDDMICGRDFHGGRQFGGCGQRFKWSQAVSYTAGVGAHDKVKELMLEMREMAPAKHLGVQCRICGVEDIVGLRFRCIECEDGFNICSECSFIAGWRHHNHAFELVPGDISTDLAIVDPRLNTFGALFSQALAEGQTIVAVLPSPEDDAASKCHAYLRPLLESHSSVLLLDVPANAPLGSQLSMRYNVPRPCVIAINPLTRYVLHAWNFIPDDINRFSEQIEALPKDVLMPHRVELLAVHAHPGQDPDGLNFFMSVKLPPQVNDLGLENVNFRIVTSGDFCWELLCEQYNLVPPCLACVQTSSGKTLKAWGGELLKSLCCDCFCDIEGFLVSV